MLKNIILKIKISSLYIHQFAKPAVDVAIIIHRSRFCAVLYTSVGVNLRSWDIWFSWVPSSLTSLSVTSQYQSWPIKCAPDISDWLNKAQWENKNMIGLFRIRGESKQAHLQFCEACICRCTSVSFTLANLSISHLSGHFCRACKCRWILSTVTNCCYLSSDSNSCDELHRHIGIASSAMHRINCI